MAIETERKFLVDVNLFNEIYPNKEDTLENFEIEQYYLYSSKDISVRLRKQGSQFFNCIKYNPVGISTTEVTLRISSSEYYNNVDLKIGRIIKKTRYHVTHYGKIWEIDFFHDELKGLVVAELECDDAASLSVNYHPIWVGKEVTSDYQFKNAVLAVSDDWKKVSPVQTTFGLSDQTHTRPYAVIVLNSKAEYQNLDMLTVQQADFVAYKTGNNYVVAKNRFDSRLGITSEKEIQLLIQNVQNGQRKVSTLYK